MKERRLCVRFYFSSSDPFVLLEGFVRLELLFYRVLLSGFFKTTPSISCVVPILLLFYLFRLYPSGAIIQYH